jgi:hypothetical protein
MKMRADVAARRATESRDLVSSAPISTRISLQTTRPSDTARIACRVFCKLLDNHLSISRPVGKSRDLSVIVQSAIQKLMNDEAAKAKATAVAKTIAHWDGPRTAAETLIEVTTDRHGEPFMTCT